MNPTHSAVRCGVLAGTWFVFPAAGRATIADVTASSWFAGAVHPVVEYSHLGALLLLGTAAGLLGRRSSWGLPVMVFVLLGFGIALGTEGAVAPMLDTIMLTTALCLALLILGHVRLPFAFVASAAGAFALFHGVADGALMAIGGVDVPYVISFALVNAIVLALGAALGLQIQHHRATLAEHARHWWDHLPRLHARG